MLAPEVLKQDPFSGPFFIFRGKRGDLFELLYWDGQVFCLFAKRLEKGPLHELAKQLGNVSQACTIMGWCLSPCWPRAGTPIPSPISWGCGHSVRNCSASKWSAGLCAARAMRSTKRHKCSPK